MILNFETIRWGHGDRHALDEQENILCKRKAPKNQREVREILGEVTCADCLKKLR